MGTEAEQLKAKLEELERALTQLKAQKDEEIQQLRDVAEEAQANPKLEQQCSASLDQELKSAALEAELDRHKALDALRAEHQRAIEREQNLVKKEKAHDWITDLKFEFELEKNTFQEKIYMLEEKLKTPESKFADPAGTTAHVLLPDSSGERSTESGSASGTPPSDPTLPTDPAAPTDVSRFDERAHLAKWSDEVKLYQLKVHLDKTASHVFRMFSTDEKSGYKKAADALRKRFRPVDIEELRGLEFHRKVQENESVEQLGLELQRLGRKAFPFTDGKDFNRLLKGRFFQVLLTKWQRKLGAPKPPETFQELYNRARTLEQHKKQYNAASVTVK